MEDLILLGTDAVCLFPSLDAKECAKLVKEEYKNNLKFKMIVGDWIEVMRYLAVNLSRGKICEEGLRRLCPVRVSRKGRTPGITSQTVKSKDVKPNKEQWIFPDVEPNPGEERLMMAVALEVGIASSFRLHTYTFGGVN